MRTPIAVALISALISAAACGTGDPCERLRRCDIRKDACQQRVARVVACLREQPDAATAVDVTVVDAATFIDGQVAQPVPDAERVAYERWNAGLALFGLAPAGATLAEKTRDSWARVAGFYDTDTAAITILDRGYAAKSLSSVLLLAHETVHALQDISGVFTRAGAAARPGLDGRLGAIAMSEGEADLLEDLSFLRASDWRIPDGEWDDVFDHWQGWAQLTSRNSNQPVNQASLLFPYAFGTEYVRDAWRAGGFAAVDALFDDVPQSALEVIGGFGHPGPAGGWVADLGDAAVPIAPPGYERVDFDRFGWWVADAFCAREGLASAACPGRLRDDTFTVLFDPVTEVTAAFWRLRFETAAAAEQFAAVIPEPYIVEQRARDIILSRVSPAGRAVDFTSMSWQSASAADAEPPPAPRILCPRKPEAPWR